MSPILSSERPDQTWVIRISPVKLRKMAYQREFGTCFFKTKRRNKRIQIGAVNSINKATPTQSLSIATKQKACTRATPTTPNAINQGSSFLFVLSSDLLNVKQIAKRITKAPPVLIWVRRQAERPSTRTIFEMMPLKEKRRAPESRYISPRSFVSTRVLYRAKRLLQKLS